MSDIKIQPSATGSATVTLTAPATGTARTVTLPDATETLVGVDQNGNLGIAVTAETDWTIYNAIQVGGTAVFAGNDGTAVMGENWKFAGGNKYINASEATRYYTNNGDHVFQVAPSGAADSAITWTTALEIDGDVKVSTGDLLFGTANKGVVLGATTNVDANTLDDYEEGTFTPLLKFSGATTGIAQESNYTTGWYTKVGNLVNFGFILILSNKGSASGSAQITGLPFALNDVTYQQTTLSLSMENVSFADQHWAYMPRNQSVITLRESTNAGSGSNIADTNVANNSQFMCQGSYISG